jgi:hypothetical protein
MNWREDKETTMDAEELYYAMVEWVRDQNIPMVDEADEHLADACRLLIPEAAGDPPANLA